MTEENEERAAKNRDRNYFLNFVKPAYFGRKLLSSKASFGNQTSKVCKNSKSSHYVLKFSPQTKISKKKYLRP